MKVFVTGAGAVSPLGQGLDAFRAGLAATPEGAPALRVDRVAGLDPIESRRTDRLSRMAVAAGREALGRSGLELEGRTERVGVLIGTMTGGLGPSLGYLDRALQTDGPAASPAAFTNAIRNGPAAHVALDLGLQGPGFTVCHAEASGLAALWHANRLIQEGRADAVLAGGAEEATSQISEILGSRGYSAGEGAYLVLLESEALARDRQAVPLAELGSVACVSAPALPWMPPDDDDAIVQCLTRALKNNRLEPGQIDRLLTASHGVADVEQALGRALERLFGGSSEQPARRDLSTVLGGGGCPAVSTVLAAVGLFCEDAAVETVLAHGSGWGGHYLAAVLERMKD